MTFISLQIVSFYKTIMLALDTGKESRYISPMAIVKVVKQFKTYIYAGRVSIVNWI